MNASNQPIPPRSERGFWALTALQFQGAFSDNLFRMSLMLIAALVLTDANDLGRYTAILQMLFPVAYILFSIWAGFMADRFSKKTMTLGTKWAELGLMLLAMASFMQMGPVDQMTVRSFIPVTIVLFFMFAQSAFFSPSKYGIIPELVRPERLGWANGIIGLTTNVSIVLGVTLATGLVHFLAPGRLAWIPLVLVGLSAAGLVCGMAIDPVPAANPGRPVAINPLPDLLRYLRELWQDRVLARTVMGLAYFWGLGALMMTHVVTWSRDELGCGQIGQGAFYLVLALGIGAGSAMAGALSRKRIEVGLIPLGALGIGLFAFPLALATPERRLVMGFSLAMVGVSGGMFSVPLNALLQQRANPRRRGGLLAASSYVTESAMLLSGALLFLMNMAGLRPNMVFVLVGCLTLIGTVVVLSLTPESLLRLIAFLLTRSIYRIRLRGEEHIPAEGGVLMIANHVSYVDALLLGAASTRPVRFVAYESFFDRPVLGWFLRATRSIPIGSTQRPRELKRSLGEAAQALEAGEIVCIFAEGQITRTGQLLPFRRGYELILRQFPAPVMPVYLDGVWGSIFSFSQGRFFHKRPRRIPYPVRIVFGAPLAADTDAFTVRQAVSALGAEAAMLARQDERPLHHTLVATARGHWGRFAMTDLLTPPMAWGRVLTGSIALGRALHKEEWRGQQSVGVLLPPSVAGAMVNYAAAFGGRVAINLNYTLGREALEHCVRVSGIESVVTSRKFLEKAGIEAPARPIFIEDVRKRISKGAGLRALLAARLAPVRWIERTCGAAQRPTPDSTATIIFSSGSTGMPKGVPLTHFNIGANIRSFSQAIRFDPTDRLLATLPFFHSFGYTVSLWGGAWLPFGSVFHHNPLDTRTIGELCEGQGVTLVITTPTFLQLYARRIGAAQMGGVNCVVAGAERLPDHVAEAFEKQFGVEPLQGYGTTECSPVVSVNVSDHRSTGIRQVGNKRGSVGHPLPGVAVRVVDPDSGQPLGLGAAGLLHIKGPNVMSGYLGQPEKSAEVLHDGWYNTGDVGYLDEDGFIWITGRLSRFSKIGGEMVPHVTIEDRLQELLNAEERRVAVTGVPDPRRGEQLVVLHTLEPDDAQALMEKLAGAGLPNIFIPRREYWLRVETLPMLGSGKLDLKAIEQLARERAATVQSSEE